MSVDVAEQLFPNLLTVITQLCATFILFIFAKKFLWKTALEMIEARKSAVQAPFEEAQKLNLEAQDNFDKAQEELKQSQVKAHQIIDTAVKEASEQKERILADAKQEADAHLNRAELSIEKKKQELQSNMQKEIVEVAIAASEKLMASSDLSAVQKQSLDDFVKELADE